MQVFFRVDASILIGTGHVMRCLTLANALSLRGANCRFICRAHEGNLLDLIAQHGFEAFSLPMDCKTIAPEHLTNGKSLAHADWLGAGWRTDAEQSLEVISDSSVDWLVVDHYALDARWEIKLRSVCNRLMVIDDLADRQHDCNVLLDQNVGRQPSDYLAIVPGSCQLLIGSEYALLRPEFQALRYHSLKRRAEPELKQMLISMGGVDQTDATSRVLASLRSCAVPDDFKIIVVMGQSAPWLERVQSFADSMPFRTEVHSSVTNMAELMANSDVAIGTAGTTSWERCCLGLPSMLIVVADNQWVVARNLERLNAAAVIGGTEDIESALPAKFDEFFSLCNLREMVTAASSVIDGRGTTRVAMKLETDSK